MLIAIQIAEVDGQFSGVLPDGHSAVLDCRKFGHLLGLLSTAACGTFIEELLNDFWSVANTGTDPNPGR
jgi:hypothetical protein